MDMPLSLAELVNLADSIRYNLEALPQSASDFDQRRRRGLLDLAERLSRLLRIEFHFQRRRRTSLGEQLLNDLP